MATTAQTTKTIHDGEVLEANAPRKLAPDLARADGPGPGSRGIHAKRSGEGMSAGGNFVGLAVGRERGILRRGKESRRCNQ